MYIHKVHSLIVKKTLDGFQSIIGLFFVLSLWKVLQQNDSLLNIWHGNLGLDSCIISELGGDVSNKSNDHLEHFDILGTFDLSCGFNEIEYAF